MCLILIPAILAGCHQGPGEPILVKRLTYDQLALETAVELEVAADSERPTLIKIRGHEVEYETRILNADGEAIRSSYLPYNRLTPHYLVLKSEKDLRKYTFEVTPRRMTRNASVQVEVVRLSNSSGADRQLVEAFELYDDSIQTADSEVAAIWGPRIDALELAARLFSAAGRDYESLWADTLASYLTYFPIYDNKGAIASSRRNLARARRAGFHDIELMNRQTIGQALIERDMDDTLELTKSKQLQAQEEFKSAVELARANGFDFEEAWATNNRGIGYFYLDMHDEAIEYYQLALQMATDLRADFLVNLVVGNLGLAKAKKGDYLGELKTLESLTGYFRENGSTFQLISNLTEIGRIHRQLYQFPEAVDVLSQALELAKSTDDMEAQGRIELWMAKAFYSMGYLERAESLINRSIVDLEAVNDGRFLRECHQLAADSARALGNFANMQFHREKQGEFLSSDLNHASYYYDLGQDQLALDEPNTELAFDYFSQAVERSTDLENVKLQPLLTLLTCSLVSEGSQHEGCSLARLRQEYGSLMSGALPRSRVKGMSVWAKILVDHGERDEAVIVLEDLIGLIRLYRTRLPGVLGA